MYELTSMDYWAPNNSDFQHPTRTVKFAPELNVVQILDKVVDALLTGSIREAKSIIKEVNVLNEASRSKAERIEWAQKMGLPKSSVISNNILRDYAGRKGLSEEVEVFLGFKEENTFEGELKKVEKSFDKKRFANPDTVFEDIEDLLGLVASNQWRTLIVCGMGGVGKTFHITSGKRSLKTLLGPEG